MTPTGLRSLRTRLDEHWASAGAFRRFHTSREAMRLLPGLSKG